MMAEVLLPGVALGDCLPAVVPEPRFRGVANRAGISFGAGIVPGG